LKEQEALFNDDADAAQKLLDVGDTKVTSPLSPARLAAATMVATALLNHDEAVMRR
jgi:hypothetical protein